MAYTVQEDDTLGSIASKVHRSKAVLHAANHGVIGSNPENLTPGTVLEIPEAQAKAAADGDDEGDDDDGA